MTIPSVIADSIKVPGSYVQVSLGVGPRSAGSAPISVCLTGNKTSAGTATVEEAVRVYTPDDAKTLFGPGSELALMCAKIFAAYPAVNLTAIPITVSGGTDADETIVFAGTATADGAVTVWISNLGKVVVSITVGDANTAVATAVAAAINDKTDWPVTAAVVTDTVTVTGKHAGPRANFIAIRALQEVGTGITMTPPSGAYLSSGATMDDPTNALAAIAPARYHFIVAPYDSTTELLLYKTHVNTNAGPLQGRRQRVICGSIDTLASTITVSDAVNFERGEIGWHYNGLDTPAEIAAAMAGVIADKNGSNRAYNYDDVVVPGIAPQVTLSDQPVFTETDSALNSGITPLGVAFGESYIVRRVTNYHLDGSSNPDFTVLDGHKVDVPDYIADDFQGSFRTDFPNAQLNDDVEGEEPEPGVVTPNMLKDWAYDKLHDHEDGRLLKKGSVAARKAELVFEIDGDVEGRVNATIPTDVVELLHQGSLDVRQVG